MVNSVETVAPGIWRIRIGEPEPFTPLTYRTASSRLDGLASLPPIPEPPFDLDSVVADLTPRGLALELPTRPDEDFYGGGLQLKSFRQTGLRKRLCVNSDPVADTGDSHAPVPFYLSTAGYGVYIDTFRTATIYFASHSRHGESADVASGTKGINTDFDTLYARAGSGRRVEIDIPTARGADLYIFSGPSMLDALRRYVFFSGGGAMPPLWGLGVWYRCYGSFGQEAATDLAMRLRERAMPCDVYGLEPGWQSHAYSCSFLWDRVRFPDPETFINRMTASGFHLNLWEHAFTHPTAPFYDELRLCAGSHEVFEGIVPDFTTANAQALFSEHHEALARQGVSGFKLDECDGSDFIKSPWTFPDHAKFPGGLDGEQYHAAFGVLYSDTINKVFRRIGRRTFGSVRSLGALASPLPYVLYSDLYNHRDFLRGMATAGVCGLLWTPEVRDATSAEDLVRRIQSVILSPQALINSWYIPMPPWEQTDIAANARGERMAGWEACEALVRDVLILRMRLIPYIYTAFAKYYFDGVPPFRPLVLEDPCDESLRDVSDQYMVGSSLLVAPMVSGEAERKIVLPKGDWMDFATDELFHGGQTITYFSPIERVPIFVRANTLLPMAEPVQCVRSDTVFRIIARAFGTPLNSAVLFEDDGESFAFEQGHYNWVTVQHDGSMTRRGSYDGPARYMPMVPIL